jgi:uridine kinase
MDIWDRLILTILQEINAKGQYFSFPHLIIDGFTASGKSSFAKHMTKYFKKIQALPTLVCTDDFIKYTRKSRSRMMLEGIFNHCETYDIERINTLCKLCSDHASIDVFVENLYNHVTGELDANATYIFREETFLVIEGMYALNVIIEPSFRTLFLASKGMLLQRVLGRDFNERGVSENTSRERFWLHNGNHFQNNLMRNIANIDLVVDTTDFENLEIISRQKLEQKEFQETVKALIFS